MDCRKLTLGLFALILAAVATCVARGDEPAPVQGPPECWVEASCHAIDGDTLVGTVHYPWGVSLQVTIRAGNYDAWEATRHRRTVEISDAELARGKRATYALAELLDSGRLFVSPMIPARDAYGRQIGKLMVVADGKRIDVAKFMRDGGHVRPQEAAK